MLAGTELHSAPGKEWFAMLEGARRQDLPTAIDSLGLTFDSLMLASRRCFNRHNSTQPLVDWQVRFDPVLEALGLVLVVAPLLRRAVEAPKLQLSHRQRHLLMAFQVGLVLRILDQTQRHLQDRMTGGTKTFQRDHIRIAFGRAVEVTELIKANSDRTLTESEYEFQQQLLREVSAEPLKMMGGHGYLISGSSSLGYLLAILQSLSSGSGRI